MKEITEVGLKIIGYCDISNNDLQSECEEIAKKERKYLLKQLNIVTDYKYRDNPPYPELTSNQMMMMQHLLTNSVNLLDLRGWHCQEYLSYIPDFALRMISEAGYYFSHIYLYHNEYEGSAENLYDELKPAVGRDPIVIGNPIRSRKKYLICQWGKDIILPSQLDKMFNEKLRCYGRGETDKWKICKKGVHFNNDLTTSKYCAMSECEYLDKSK